MATRIDRVTPDPRDVTSDVRTDGTADGTADVTPDVGQVPSGPEPTRRPGTAPGLGDPPVERPLSQPPTAGDSHAGAGPHRGSDPTADGTVHPVTGAPSTDPPTQDPSTPSAPPPSHPTPDPLPHAAGDPPRARLGWRGWVAAAVAGALGASLVVVPTLLLTSDPAPLDTVAAPGAAEETAAATLAATPVGAIARQVGPSVARVDAQGALGAGSGSAVVYQADGVLVTNAHVIEGAQLVTVTLPDAERLPAEVIGTDPRSDLAVLRVEAEDLPVPVWADEHEVAVGDPTVAIGSPFGLDGSVTSGIISALGRTVQAGNGTALVDLLQTDAAINPGNSGGALVDGTGRVIGVNTAIASSSGGNEGIGFAIPAGTVRAVADQLLTDGEVRHAEIGIVGQSVDPDIARLYGLSVERGAVLADIRPDGPADAAGLQRGDIVTALDGDPVDTIADLIGRIQLRRPGDEVTLTIVRGSETLEVDVQLTERQDGR